jgi:O-acetyl-ADP-ribose deacetylase (regulator of RNase III)
MPKPAMQIAEENVKSAMEAALECAETLKIRSIAFPGLGTGVGGIPIQTAATTMAQQLKKHLENPTSLKEITFVGFTQESAEAFKKAIKRVFSN